MRHLVAAGLLVLIAALVVAGCGGGGTTTVIERTVTVESGGEEGLGAAESQTEEEEREAIAKVEEEAAQEGSEGEVPEEEEEAGEVEETAQPEEQIEEPTMIVHLQTFRSPSGNIGCAMFEGGARCDIKKREWSPPARPSSCSEEVDFGQGLNVAHVGKASFVCAGDTALDPTTTALDYGEASELGGTICMSRSEGITCANHAGHGFFISIQSYKIF